MKAVAGDSDIAGSGFLPVGVNHPEADREVGHDQGAPDDERRDTATSGGKNIQMVTSGQHIRLSDKFKRALSVPKITPAGLK